MSLFITLIMVCSVTLFFAGMYFLLRNMASRSTISTPLSTERFAVSISTLVLGIGMLGAWFFYLIKGWDSFMAQTALLFPHVMLQLFSAISLLLAGYGIYKQWKNQVLLFSLSAAVLFIGSIYALSKYANMGDPNTMYILGVIILVVGVIFNGLTMAMDLMQSKKHI